LFKSNTLKVYPSSLTELANLIHRRRKMTKDLKNTAELFGFVAAGLAVIGAMVIASLV
jgi:hypothetical protein